MTTAVDVDVVRFINDPEFVVFATACDEIFTVRKSISIIHSVPHFFHWLRGAVHKQQCHWWRVGDYDANTANIYWMKLNLLFDGTNGGHRSSWTKSIWASAMWVSQRNQCNKYKSISLPNLIFIFVAHSTTIAVACITYHWLRWLRIQWKNVPFHHFHSLKHHFDCVHSPFA